MRFYKFGPINTEQIMRKRLISEINSAKFRSFEFLKVSIAVFLGSVNNGIVAEDTDFASVSFKNLLLLRMTIATQVI